MTSGGPYPRTCAALSAIGVNPGSVSIDGLDITGYQEIVMTGGKRALDSEYRLVVSPRSWPEGVPIGKIAALVGAYLTEKREAEKGQSA